MANGFTHLLVAVDKFTKWMEVKPIKKLDSVTTIKFIKEVILRFGVPHSIMTDNGSNFDSDQFRDLCYTQGTRVDYAFMAHTRSDGQAEQANGMILQGLKPRLMRDLEHATRAWVTELPSVLQGLQTSPNRSTNCTPFFMVYGAKAILLSNFLHNSPEWNYIQRQKLKKHVKMVSTSLGKNESWHSSDLLPTSRTYGDTTRGK
nr:uncharacterized protein LOC109752040 [Aegilops tauschii subsp. strangulata]